MRTIGAIIYKEMLLYLRNPQELLVMLAMPFVLIMILGFALGTVLSGDEQAVNSKAAIVLHGDEEEEVQSVLALLEKTSLPDEWREQIASDIQQTSPIMILQEQIFGAKELAEIIELEELPVEELEKAKKGTEYAAIIEVPAGFTKAMLETIILNKQEVPSLTVYTNEGKEMSAAIVEDVLYQFQQQYSVNVLLGKEQIFTEMEEGAAVGKIESLTKRDPIDSFSYYTVGMSVMFVLFIASIMSSRSYKEKKMNVIDRIFLANIPTWMYVTGVFISTIMIAFIQMMILYSGAALFYQVHWPNIPAFILISFLLCMTVGGIAVFLMALCFRFENEGAPKLFMNGIVSVLAFFGGSFVPLSQLSNGLEVLGDLTPNGAAMSAYLRILQGEDFASIQSHLLVLLSLTCLLLLATLFVFPRKAGAK